jgi:muramidase (phage lysozyme)
MSSRKQLELAVVNPNVRKFLDLIAHTEGTEGNGYRTAFGGGRLSSLKDHPRYLKSFTQKNGKTNKTSAAGRYQFLKGTWDGLAKKYGLRDFGAKNQDLGAVALLSQNGALQDLLDGNWQDAVRKSGATWASLPTAPASYSQPTKSWQTVNKFMGGNMSAQAPAMTNKQKAKIYSAYKSGKMSAYDKAQYESDVKAGLVDLPKNAKLMDSKPSAKAKTETLPLGVVLAYNNGEMDAASQSQLDADIKAGIVTAPKGFKLKKPKPKGLIGRSSDKVGAAAKQVTDNQFDNGGVSNVVGAADAALGVVGGMADMAMTGMAGIGGMAGAAMRGQPIVDGFSKGADNYNNTAVSGVLKSAATPRTETGSSFMDVLGIADDAIVEAGDYVYDKSDSPFWGAATQTGLNFGALLMGKGSLTKPRTRGSRPPIDDGAAPRRQLSQEELRARVREADNRRADGARLGRDEGAPVPVRQPSPLDTYNDAMARSTGGITGAAANLDALNAQAARTSAGIANLDTTPRPDYSNAQASPPPEVIINRPEPKASAPIETLLDLDGSKPQVGGVPIDVQGLRAEVLRDLGIADENTRKGAITGDITQLETEKALSKLDTNAGREIREKMDDEYSVMNDYANRIIEDDIGARAGASPESRGQVVIDALQNYKDWYKEQVKADYSKADELMGGRGGIELSDFNKELNQNSAWQGKKENQQLRRGIRSYLKEMDLVDKDGAVKPMTAKQAESLRQYINSQWTPSSAGLIARVNESIDMGVFSKLDDNAYVDARARYRQYKQMFENPKGIGKILDIDGINSKVSPEQIGRNIQQLAAKDGAQFNHIYDLLDKMPDDLSKQGARAKAEIQAAIAESILGKAGLKTVNKEYMQYRKPNDDGSYKAAAIFGDEVAKKIDTYIAGRNILQHQDPNPSGTATTAANLDQWNSPENMSSAAIGVTTAVATGGNAMIGAAAGAASKVAQSKIKNALTERQNKAELDVSYNPKRAQAYRAANEKLANKVIDTTEMKAILEEFEKSAPNETKLKVLQKRLAKTDEWKAYVKTLPKKARKAAINNADVLTMLTQGANSQDDAAFTPTF